MRASAGPSLSVALAVALALGWLATPARASVDPFYLSRLQEGITSAERSAWADAVKSFRVACFGMIDEEPQLADCLLRLAMAQAAAGDREGFSQTFARVVEGEELIGLYSKGNLPSDRRSAFEAKVVELIPRSALAASPAFQRLAADQRETQLAALPPKARRERLAKLEKDEPKSSRWPLLLARLEKEQRQPREALAAAGRALALDPKLVEARCLRGWARAESGKYAQAAEDLAGCRTMDPAFAVAELRSSVELERWSDAEALLAALPPEQRALADVSALASRVEKAVPRRMPPNAATAPAPAPAAAAGRPGGAPSGTVTTPAAAPATVQTRPTEAATRAGNAPKGPSATTSRSGEAVNRPGAVPSAASRTPPSVSTVAAAGRPSGAAQPGAPATTYSSGAPIGGALPPADESLLARAQSQLSRARTAAEIEDAYAVASELGRRYPAHPRVQHTAAEIAYRASRWADSVRHFRQGGDPGEGQPLLLFYLAVALWESGDHPGAAAVMRRCDGKLRPTPFVQDYRSRILGTRGS